MKENASAPSQGPLPEMVAQHLIKLLQTFDEGKNPQKQVVLLQLQSFATQSSAWMLCLQILCMYGRNFNPNHSIEKHTILFGPQKHTIFEVPSTSIDDSSSFTSHNPEKTAVSCKSATSSFREQQSEQQKSLSSDEFRLCLFAAGCIKQIASTEFLPLLNEFEVFERPKANYENRCVSSLSPDASGSPSHVWEATASSFDSNSLPCEDVSLSAERFRAPLGSPFDPLIRGSSHTLPFYSSQQQPLLYNLLPKKTEGFQRCSPINEAKQASVLGAGGIGVYSGENYGAYNGEEAAFPQAAASAYPVGGRGAHTLIAASENRLLKSSNFLSELIEEDSLSFTNHQFLVDLLKVVNCTKSLDYAINASLYEAVPYCIEMLLKHNDKEDSRPGNSSLLALSGLRSVLYWLWHHFSKLECKFSSSSTISLNEQHVESIDSASEERDNRGERKSSGEDGLRGSLSSSGVRGATEMTSELPPSTLEQHTPASGKSQNLAVSHSEAAKARTSPSVRRQSPEKNLTGNLAQSFDNYNPPYTDVEHTPSFNTQRVIELHSDPLLLLKMKPSSIRMMIEVLRSIAEHFILRGGSPHPQFRRFIIGSSFSLCASYLHISQNISSVFQCLFEVHTSIWVSEYVAGRIYRDKQDNMNESSRKNASVESQKVSASCSSEAFTASCVHEADAKEKLPSTSEELGFYASKSGRKANEKPYKEGDFQAADVTESPNKAGDVFASFDKTLRSNFDSSEMHSSLKIPQFTPNSSESKVIEEAAEKFMQTELSTAKVTGNCLGKDEKPPVKSLSNKSDGDFLAASDLHAPLTKAASDRRPPAPPFSNKGNLQQFSPRESGGKDVFLGDNSASSLFYASAKVADDDSSFFSLFSEANLDLHFSLEKEEEDDFYSLLKAFYRCLACWLQLAIQIVRHSFSYDYYESFSDNPSSNRLEMLDAARRDPVPPNSFSFTAILSKYAFSWDEHSFEQISNIKKSQFLPYLSRLFEDEFLFSLLNNLFCDWQEDPLFCMLKVAVCSGISSFYFTHTLSSSTNILSLLHKHCSSVNLLDFDIPSIFSSEEFGSYCCTCFENFVGFAVLSPSIDCSISPLFPLCISLLEDAARRISITNSQPPQSFVTPTSTEADLLRDDSLLMNRASVAKIKTICEMMRNIAKYLFPTLLLLEEVGVGYGSNNKKSSSYNKEDNSSQWNDVISARSSTLADSWRNILFAKRYHTSQMHSIFFEHSLLEVVAVEGKPPYEQGSCEYVKFSCTVLASKIYGLLNFVEVFFRSCSIAAFQGGVEVLSIFLNASRGILVEHAFRLGEGRFLEAHALEYKEQEMLPSADKASQQVSSSWDPLIEPKSSLKSPGEALVSENLTVQPKLCDTDANKNVGTRSRASGGRALIGRETDYQLTHKVFDELSHQMSVLEYWQLRMDAVLGDESFCKGVLRISSMSQWMDGIRFHGKSLILFLLLSKNLRSEADSMLPKCLLEMLGDEEVTWLQHCVSLFQQFNAFRNRLSVMLQMMHFFKGCFWSRFVCETLAKYFVLLPQAQAEDFCERCVKVGFTDSFMEDTMVQNSEAWQPPHVLNHQKSGVHSNGEKWISAVTHSMASGSDSASSVNLQDTDERSSSKVSEAVVNAITGDFRGLTGNNTQSLGKFSHSNDYFTTSYSEGINANKNDNTALNLAPGGLLRGGCDSTISVSIGDYTLSRWEEVELEAALWLLCQCRQNEGLSEEFLSQILVLLLSIRFKHDNMAAAEIRRKKLDLSGLPQHYHLGKNQRNPSQKDALEVTVIACDKTEGKLTDPPHTMKELFFRKVNGGSSFLNLFNTLLLTSRFHSLGLWQLDKLQLPHDAAKHHSSLNCMALMAERLMDTTEHAFITFNFVKTLLLSLWRTMFLLQRFKQNVYFKAPFLRLKSLYVDELPRIILSISSSYMASSKAADSAVPGAGTQVLNRSFSGGKVIAPHKEPKIQLAAAISCTDKESASDLPLEEDNNCFKANFLSSDTVQAPSTTLGSLTDDAKPTSSMSVCCGESTKDSRFLSSEECVDSASSPSHKRLKSSIGQNVYNDTFKFAPSGVLRENLHASLNKGTAPLPAESLHGKLHLMKELPIPFIALIRNELQGANIDALCCLLNLFMDNASLTAASHSFEVQGWIARDIFIPTLLCAIQRHASHHQLLSILSSLSRILSYSCGESDGEQLRMRLHKLLISQLSIYGWKKENTHSSCSNTGELQSTRECTASSIALGSPIVSEPPENSLASYVVADSKDTSKDLTSVHKHNFHPSHSPSINPAYDLQEHLPLQSSVAASSREHPTKMPLMQKTPPLLFTWPILNHIQVFFETICCVRWGKPVSAVYPLSTIQYNQAVLLENFKAYERSLLLDIKSLFSTGMIPCKEASLSEKGYSGNVETKDVEEQFSAEPSGCLLYEDASSEAFVKKIALIHQRLKRCSSLAKVEVLKSSECEEEEELSMKQCPSLEVVFDTLLSAPCESLEKLICYGGVSQSWDNTVFYKFLRLISLSFDYFPSHHQIHLLYSIMKEFVGNPAQPVLKACTDCLNGMVKKFIKEFTSCKEVLSVDRLNEVSHYYTSQYYSDLKLNEVEEVLSGSGMASPTMKRAASPQELLSALNFTPEGLPAFYLNANATMLIELLKCLNYAILSYIFAVKLFSDNSYCILQFFSIVMLEIIPLVTQLSESNGSYIVQLLESIYVFLNSCMVWLTNDKFGELCSIQVVSGGVIERDRYLAEVRQSIKALIANLVNRPSPLLNREVASPNLSTLVGASTLPASSISLSTADNSHVTKPLITSSSSTPLTSPIPPGKSVSPRIPSQLGKGADFKPPGKKAGGLTVSTRHMQITQLVSAPREVYVQRAALSPKVTRTSKLRAPPDVTPKIPAANLSKETSSTPAASHQQLSSPLSTASVGYPQQKLLAETSPGTSNAMKEGFTLMDLMIYHLLSQMLRVPMLANIPFALLSPNSIPLSISSSEIPTVIPPELSCLETAAKLLQKVLYSSGFILNHFDDILNRELTKVSKFAPKAKSYCVQIHHILKANIAGIPAKLPILIWFLHKEVSKVQALKLFGTSSARYFIGKGVASASFSGENFPFKMDFKGKHPSRSVGKRVRNKGSKTPYRSQGGRFYFPYGKNVKK